MKGKQKMKKKILSISLVVALLATGLIGATLAYFTDTEEASNTFTMGNVDITLDEAKVDRVDDAWVAGNDRVTSNEYEDIYPGVVLPKDPTVHNEGTYGAFVRTKITVDFNKLAGMQEDKELFNNEAEDGDLTNILNIDTANWTFADYEVDFANRTVTYTYNYNTELASETDTEPVFTEVSIPAHLTNEVITAYGLNNFNIDIIAEAIQADGFNNVTEAFAAFAADAE